MLAGKNTGVRRTKQKGKVERERKNKRGKQPGLAEGDAEPKTVPRKTPDMP